MRPDHPQAGDRIHVEFDGVVGEGGGLMSTTPVTAAPELEGNGGNTLHYVYLGDPSVYTVLPQDPPAEPPVRVPLHWPPQVGEFWVHGPSDRYYTVRANTCYEGSVVFTTNDPREDEIYVPAERCERDRYGDEAVPLEWMRILRAPAEG